MRFQRIFSIAVLIAFIFTGVATVHAARISSILLLLPGPITTVQDIRISLWSDGRFESGDVTGGGAINGAAPNYAGYQTVITRTPDSSGRVEIAFGALAAFPELTDVNQFLMVEYKEDADPDTSYVVYDETYFGSVMDRFPLLVGGPDVYQGIYTNDATSANTFTLDRDSDATDVTLRFGQTLDETLKWNDAQNYFEFSDALVVGGNASVNGNIVRVDADNIGADANVDIVAEQGTDADGTLRYNATLDRWEISNDGGLFLAISSGTIDFEAVYASDADKVITTGNSDLTVSTGSQDFIVNSNDWNVDAAGALDAASLSSGGSLAVTGTATLNGAANIGDGGDDVSINSNDWDVSSAGVASGLTGLTSTGTVNLSGSSSLRIREEADEAAATCTTVKEVLLDTTENRLYICTVVGAPGTWVASSSADAQTLDGFDSSQFLRSDVSDSFSSGVLTLDNGTTLTVNGAVTLGDGGDDIAINSNDWDVSSAGVASGLTGVASTGTVNFSGSSSLRIREVADEATAACTTVKELVLDTTENVIYVCTVTGSPGTWLSTSTPVSLDLPAVQARRTTTLGLTGSFADVTFDATDLENATAVVEHDNTNTDRITVKETGIYQITYDFSVSLPTTIVTASAASAQVRVNDTTVLNGSQSSISIPTNGGTEIMELTQSFVLSLTANDFLSVQLSSTGDAPTVQTQGLFTVTKMEGIKGDPGVGSADSDTLDSLDSTQFLRSDTSDNFTSGSLTFDAGTTLDLDAATVDLDEITNNTLILDSNNTGGNVSLQFGGTLAESLTWNDASSRFDLSDDLNITGGLIVSAAIDFNQNQATELVLDQGVAFPGSPVEGQKFWRTDLNQEFVFNGTGWVSTSQATSNVSIYLNPEFAHTVVSADGTNNDGTMFADRDGTDFRNFYQWEANTATMQDIDVIVSLSLPDDFSSFQAAPLSIDYRTNDADLTDAQIDVSVLDTADTAVSLTGGANLNSLTWATENITFGGSPTFVAGDRMTISFKFQARQDAGAGAARSAFIGPLILNYIRK